MTAAIYPKVSRFVELIDESCDVIILTEDAQCDVQSFIDRSDPLPEGVHVLGRMWSYRCPDGIAPIESAYYGTRDY